MLFFTHPTARAKNKDVSAKSLFSEAIFTSNDVFAFRDAKNDDTRVLSSARKTRPAGLDLFISVLSLMAELASFVVVVGEVRFGDQAITMPEVSSLPASCMRSMGRGVSWWCFVLKRTVCGLKDRSEVICSHRNRCQRLLAGYSLPLSIAFSN